MKSIPIRAVGMLFAAAVPAQAQTIAANLPPAAAHGRTLYLADGCYQCHGEQGQGGSNSGPRLAPGPIPYEAFSRQLRNPRDRMPVFTPVTVTDPDMADIYAYLQAVPKAKTVDEIPLLKSLRPGRP